MMKKTPSKKIRLLISCNDDEPPRIFERSVEATVDDLAKVTDKAVAAFNDVLNVELDRVQHAA
jgi:hypothetical protein